MEINSAGKNNALKIDCTNYKDENTINEHINNVFKEKESDENTSTEISGKSTGGRKPKVFNLM